MYGGPVCHVDAGEPCSARPPCLRLYSHSSRLVLGFEQRRRGRRVFGCWQMCFFSHTRGCVLRKTLKYPSTTVHFIQKLMANLFF
ncbi:hypothetical protein HanRHA438_Chr03g0101061 [Helianthus annuus]|nr:hypothetical protein HanRHA438_Chr03g0101061 [Helianthus annuus]